MRADGLREMTADEIEARVQELREQLLKLRFQQSTGQIESPQMLRAVRKDIARAKTVLRERDLGVSAGVAVTAAVGVEAEAAPQNDTQD
jgi:large subunit ribosomal protein L29